MLHAVDIVIAASLDMHSSTSVCCCHCLKKKKWRSTEKGENASLYLYINNQLESADAYYVFIMHRIFFT